MHRPYNTLRFELDPGLAAGPADEPEESEPPAAPPAPDFTEAFTSPEFRDSVGQAVVGVLSQMADSEAPGAEQADFDFYGADPAEVQQYLNQIVEQKVQALTSRYEPAIQQMEVASWQEKIDRTVGELETVKQIDQLFAEDHPADQGAGVMVERLAAAFLPEMTSLYGEGDRAVEGALRAAADYALPIVKAAHSAGYAARNAELQRLSGAPAPPPSQGGEAQLVNEPQDEFEALARDAERHGMV